jgi:methionyl-tRNA formyltransferase
VFLGNNWVGWQVLKFLKEQNENIVGLVVHPQGKRKFGKEIISAANVNGNRIIEGQTLRQPEVLEAIKTFQPDIGVSILFDYVLKTEFLALFPLGVVNLHSSYLPYNRGQYPNVWSIVEGTPAGVTLHYIDEGIDTGDLIAQEEVAVEPVDTGETLFRKLEQTCIELFQKTWPLIRAGKAQRIIQNKVEGTYHTTRDVDRIDAIDLDKTYTARELIDVIRARTFKPYKGAYFVDQNRKIYMRMQLFYEEQLIGTEK